MSSRTASSLIELAADRLSVASAAALSLPVRQILGEDLDAAYEVQERNISLLETAANPRVGRKVGLTSVAVQRQLGVDQPDFGVLLADMDVTGLAEVPSSRLLQPRIEAEIAFILARDIESSEPEEAIAAVGEVAAALEIVDSRVRDWDISIVDTVADNASSGLFVLGDERRTLDTIDPREVVMYLDRNGERASEGSGVACLGDPLNALVWVAGTAHRLGRPLRAGEVVLSGALGPMVPFGPGTTVTAHISGLGSVSATASKE
ncbi:fumarylacetoacetate hydrolase family protein [Microbacterium esteraromaticum]|uniref:2-keto-4-pentenoate hydratase n=1 Tax=Microbacterium esteraromaticum TaxID=57043 RepID=UPI001CD2E189|nr:fumarylacetoacetate hydrolase family protein [Microbacterium esteraromaticum]MCA1307840.1 fumarylacetoacetate hydrolase family protein [Microbacterium esteraromaticum]